MTQENENGGAVDAEPVKHPKTAVRPGSQWATGKRRTLDRKPENKGFARGARIK